MHRRSGDDLLPLDIELEKTIRNLKKERATGEAAMEERREENQNVPVVVPDRPQ